MTWTRGRLIGLVIIARVKHPVPSRTRPLSTVAPMVLHLKVWESRSSPNLEKTPAYLSTMKRIPSEQKRPEGRQASKPTGKRPLASSSPPGGRPQKSVAGWSSPVARQAHNLKVVGSNPTPAPKHRRPRRKTGAFLLPYAEAAKVKYQSWPVSCFHCATSLRACFS